MDLKEYHRNYYYIRRQKIIDYLGGKCSKCEAVENLEVDHIDPKKKSVNISDNVTLNSIVDELAKCQLLCKPCHIKKTTLEKAPFTHGTVYGFMKAKCECDLCSTKKIEYNHIRNAKRRQTINGKGPYSKDPEHGTNAKYCRGCKCELCKAAHAKHNR